MSTNTYKEALNRARQLSTDELLLLMQELTVNQERDSWNG